MAKLKEYGKIITGNTPSSSNPDYFNSNDICFVKPSDIASNVVTSIIDSEYYISEDARACSRIIPAGSILVTCIGTVGKIGITQREVAFNQQINAIVPNDKVDATCLAYALLFHSDRIKAIANAPVVPIINKSTFSEIDIPLPDLPTQRRIAATLDKVSEGIAVCRQMLADLDVMVKARFVEMFGEPIQNPLGWPVVRLKEVSTLITNGNTPKGGSENYVDKGITFLRSQNVWRNRIDLEDVAYIDEATHRGLKKSSLHYKDILITKTGRINTENSSLGRAALFLGEDDSANINGHVYLIRLDGSIVPEFVVTILTGEAYRKYIRKVCVGGIDKRQINVDQVEDFPIIVPPYEKQQEFATFRDHVDKSKVAVQQQLAELETLKKSLMQEYFG